jgi:DNA-binding NtrC family response regulator
VIPSLGRKIAVEASAQQAVPQRANARLAKVLVVDEALPVVRKLTEILHRSGVSPADVKVASDAEAAVEAFALERPALVFCELVGEPETGLSMVAEMLQIDPHARIVLLTAEDPMGPVVRRAVRLGVFAVVPKPLRHEKIRAVIAEIEAEDGGVDRLR